MQTILATIGEGQTPVFASGGLMTSGKLALRRTVLKHNPLIVNVL
jgi:hypothetical protein